MPLRPAGVETSLPSARRAPQALRRAVPVHTRTGFALAHLGRLRSAGGSVSAGPPGCGLRRPPAIERRAGLELRLLDPRHAHRREYWAQVERIPDSDALRRLERGGMDLGDFRTRPCRVRLLSPPPPLPPRVPPIRHRKNVADAWLALELTEGKNRQVRRMTAAVGHPTLRLIRVRIGNFPLGDLPAGVWRELNAAQRAQVFAEASVN